MLGSPSVVPLVVELVVLIKIVALIVVSEFGAGVDVEVLVVVVVVVVSGVVSVAEHEAIWFGSPTQAEGEGALQLRDLNFFPHEQVGSQSDHSPHEAHTPTPAVGKILWAVAS